jgi:hypothetical protein
MIDVQIVTLQGSIKEGILMKVFTIKQQKREKFIMFFF